MHPATIELMHEQVRTIYRAATGADLGASEQSSTSEQAPADSDIERRFAELDELARREPRDWRAGSSVLVHAARESDRRRLRICS